jgi:hypothetical protein
MLRRRDGIEGKRRKSKGAHYDREGVTEGLGGGKGQGLSSWRWGKLGRFHWYDGKLTLGCLSGSVILNGLNERF